jgi:hypothetical protein
MNRATVERGEALCQRQAQPQPALRPIQRPRSLRERLEQCRAKGRRHAGPVVLADDLDHGAVGARRHQDLPAARRVARRVGQQVGHDLDQAVLVAVDGQP